MTVKKVEKQPSDGRKAEKPDLYFLSLILGCIRPESAPAVVGMVIKS